MINNIKASDLRKMSGSEGLILQGCGGEPQEWVDGINNMLTEAGILRDGTKFTDVGVFSNNEVTNILFPFNNDIQLATHNEFGGTWLSDYVDNNLGGFETEQKEKVKPDCALIGQDGNIFNLMGIASRTLKRYGKPEEAHEMCDRIHKSGNYYEALNIIGEYVNITDGSESEEFDDGESYSEGMRMKL